MRRLVTLLAVFTLATAAAAGAGDDVKWTKSKKTTYYPPATDPSELGDNPSPIKDIYLLQWSPYFSNDVDDVLVRWVSWEWVATGLNRALKSGAITRDAYDKKITELRESMTRYLVFEVWVEAKNKAFYDSTNEDYWEFVLITAESELRPVEFDTKGSVESKGLAVDLGGETRDVYDYAAMLINQYYVLFENPYAGAAPSSLKFLMRSEKYSRGFEWRFKED